MSTSEYVQNLQTKKTYKTRLIVEVQEYSFKSLGPIKIPPKLPRANKDRHVIAIEFRGQQPSVLSVLDDPNKTFNPVYGSADNLLFVFIDMKSHTLKIESPPKGYFLADNLQINVDFEIGFHVNKAQEFWETADDPVDKLESTIINEARDYLAQVMSSDLVVSPFDSKRDLEQHLNSQLNPVKGKLEASIRDFSFPGLVIEQIYANIVLSPELSDFLLALRKRRLIDLQISQDKSFDPYDLRTVIKVIDSGELLENFYSMPWTEAMRKVYERLAEVKKKYIVERNKNRRQELQELIVYAQKSGLDDIYIVQLKDQLAEELLKQATSSQSNMTSDYEFLEESVKRLRTANLPMEKSSKQLTSTNNEASKDEL